MAAKNLTPLLQVYDMKTSVAFYRDKLGFTVAHTYEPNGHLYWASLELGPVNRSVPWGRLTSSRSRLAIEP